MNFLKRVFCGHDNSTVRGARFTDGKAMLSKHCPSCNKSWEEVKNIKKSIKQFFQGLLSKAADLWERMPGM